MMTTLTMENPVFVTYMIAATLMILKIMGQGWMTVYRMLISDSGLASPEDLQTGLINRNPRPEQLEINDYVDRSRRMHRNDLENIPAFLACGLLFVIAAPLRAAGEHSDVHIRRCAPDPHAGLCNQTEP